MMIGIPRIIPCRVLHQSAASAAFLLVLLANALPAKAGRWKTLDYLYETSGRGTVAGVHNKISKTPTLHTSQVEQISGKSPGLWGGDFLFDAESIEHRWTMVREAKRQWEAGAIVNIMWHACNPTLNEPCSWSDHCHGDGPWSDISDSQWSDLVTEGTVVNNRWKEMMDDISQYLQWLKDNGVEVLFRPIHEMNQGCFWWGGRPGPEGTLKLYQITHDYLMSKGLDNLIWTWNIQDFATLADDANSYNPGNEYWEVATLDVYEGFTREKYDIMVNVAGGRPIGIGECWELPTASRLSNEILWTFFMSWSELTFQWPNTDEKIRALYSSDEATTLNEMPGWDSLPAKPTPANTSATNAPSIPPVALEPSITPDSTMNGSVDSPIKDEPSMMPKTKGPTAIPATNTPNAAPKTKAPTVKSTTAPISTSVNHDKNGPTEGDATNRDGYDTSSWSVEYAENEWITVDLGKDYAINRIRLRWVDVQTQISADNGVVNINVDNDYIHMQGAMKTAESSGSSLWELEVDQHGTSSIFNPASTESGNFLFRSQFDTYLCAWADGVGFQQQRKWAHWNKIPVGDGKVALRSLHGNYLSAWYDGSVRLADNISGWEQWTELANDDGTVSFRSYHGSNLLSASPDGVALLSEQNLGWEHFHEEAGSFI